MTRKTARSKSQSHAVRLEESGATTTPSLFLAVTVPGTDPIILGPRKTNKGMLNLLLASAIRYKHATLYVLGSIPDQLEGELASTWILRNRLNKTRKDTP